MVQLRCPVYNGLTYMRRGILPVASEMAFMSMSHDRRVAGKPISENPPILSLPLPDPRRSDVSALSPPPASLRD
jgi:hypothetical protein